MGSYKESIDTNVILDVLCNRTDFIAASSKVWKLCEVNKVEGYISALTVLNIIYIIRKELTPGKTQQLIQTIMLIFNVIDLKSADLVNAAQMYSSDYEDAVQMCDADVGKTDQCNAGQRLAHQFGSGP